MYEEHIFEPMTRQALKDIRTMCGFPKHSRDPKYLNEDFRRQLETARVQRRLRVAFRLDELAYGSERDTRKEIMLNQSEKA